MKFTDDAGVLWLHEERDRRGRGEIDLNLPWMKRRDRFLRKFGVKRFMGLFSWLSPHATASDSAQFEKVIRISADLFCTVKLHSRHLAQAVAILGNVAIAYEMRDTNALKLSKAVKSAIADLIQEATGISDRELISESIMRAHADQNKTKPR